MKYRLEILSVLCILLGIGVWIKFSWGYARVLSDFSGDYVAARFLRGGTPLYLESPSIVVDEETTIEDIPIYHPPFNAILFLPFSYFPYKAAFKLWNLVNLALYVFLIFLILRKLNILDRKVLLKSSFLFLWYPFASNIGLGQS
ncbi:MAG TPA: glycosyltransferase family 87 protein, partial [Candidatus Deferrimicrobiaceae bacterium]|nr:glycosyltransferase family 87 protein [Candidatus Deferrimicrobiaceae bacterium]